MHLCNKTWRSMAEHESPSIFCLEQELSFQSYLQSYLPRLPNGDAPVFEFLLPITVPQPCPARHRLLPTLLCHFQTKFSSVASDIHVSQRRLQGDRKWATFPLKQLLPTQGQACHQGAFLLPLLLSFPEHWSTLQLHHLLSSHGVSVTWQLPSPADFQATLGHWIGLSALGPGRSCLNSPQGIWVMLKLKTDRFILPLLFHFHLFKYC